MNAEQKMVLNHVCDVFGLSRAVTYHEVWLWLMLRVERDLSWGLRTP